jgi:hypothetical protein
VFAIRSKWRICAEVQANLAYLWFGANAFNYGVGRVGGPQKANRIVQALESGST